MREDLKQYQVEPDAFWLSAWYYGDGYDVMEAANRQGWNEIGSWGKPGYDLGSWPLVMIYDRNIRTNDGGIAHQVAEYCEGDVTMYTCPTSEIREQIINELAFYHWKHQGERWVEGYETVKQLPDELKGPYRL